MQTAPPKHLTIAEVALRTRLGYWAVRSLIMRGELTGGRDPESGRWWIDAVAADRFIAKRATRPSR